MVVDNVFWKEVQLQWANTEFADAPVVLVMDNFRGHKLNSPDPKRLFLKFLPPNSTSRTQPLDQGIIKSFKSRYRAWLSVQLIDCVDNWDERQSELK